MQIYFFKQKNKCGPAGLVGHFSPGVRFPSYSSISNVCLYLFSLTGRELAWQFLQDNWNELYNRYASGLLLPRLIKVTCQQTLKK